MSDEEREESALVVHLRSALQELEGLDELPHSVDDTLIDRLVEYVDVNDTTLVSFVFECFQNENILEAGTVTLSILLRISAKIVSSTGLTLSYTDRLPYLLPSLLQYPSSSLQDATLTLALSLRKSEDSGNWDPIRTWILSSFFADGISVFVRRKCIEFLCMETAAPLIEELVSLCVSFLAHSTSFFVIDSICMVLCRFKDILSTTQKKEAWKIGRKSIRLSSEFIVFLAEIGEDAFENELKEESKWMNRQVWTQVMVSVAKRHNDQQVIHCLLSTSHVSLSLISSLLPLLPQERVIELISLWRVSHCGRLLPSDLTSLLQQMIGSFPIHSLLPLYMHYLASVLKDPSPFTMTLPLLPSWTSSIPSLASSLSPSIIEGLSSSEWEERDSSLQLLLLYPIELVPLPAIALLPSLAISDPSPYVRTLSIRLLSLSSSSHFPSIASSCIKDDDDHLPRLEAAKGILKGGKKEVMEEAIPIVLRDEDGETRREGLKMAEKLMEDEEEWKMKQELMRWREDGDIGKEVRRILREEEKEEEREDDVVLELLASINIQSEDIDCY